jgi:uncharacterized phage protein (TIGR02218 family)
VNSVIGDDVFLDIPITADRFAYGHIRWLNGENVGLLADIIGNGLNAIKLAKAPHFPVMTGSRIELVEGCDKRLETCSVRFGNGINFRGEPHLPGNDLLTRYPGAG